MPGPKPPVATPPPAAGKHGGGGGSSFAGGVVNFLTVAVTVVAVVFGALQFVPQRVNIPANLLNHPVHYIPGLLSAKDGTTGPV